MKKIAKKRSSRFRVLIGILVVAVVVFFIILAVILIRNRTAPEVEEEILPVSEEGVTKPQYALGDADSDSFDFTGDYFDRAGEQTTLTIARGDEEGSYSVSILSQENEISTLAWEMEAVYDSETKSLSYDGCEHMRYLTDPDDPEADPTYIQLSGDGTGRIFLHDGALFWLDDEGDAGSGMIFTERTAE